MKPSYVPVTPPLDRYFGFLTGHVLQLRKDRFKMMRNAVETCGEFVHFKYFSQDVYLVAHPEGAKHVLQSNASNYSKKTPGFKKVMKIGGKGILVNEGDHWKKMRRLIQPFFNLSAVHSYLPDMKLLLEREFEKLGNGRVNVNELATRLTIQILGQNVFNRDFSPDVDFLYQRVSTLFDITNERMTRFIPIPTPRRISNDLKFSKSKKELDQYVLSMITRARNTPRSEWTDHLIYSLLDTKDVTDRDILDEVLTLIIAGFETSANSINWAVYLLAQHRNYQDRVFQETKSGLDRPAGFDLPYTKSVLMESLRMYPGFWMLARIALGDDVILGHPIAKGATVLVSPYFIQNHRNWWPNPESFDPERFLGERSKDVDRYSYLPFGVGPRSCIGTEFSMSEMQLILAYLCKKYSFQLVDQAPIEIRPKLSLRMDRDLWIQIERRTEQH